MLTWIVQARSNGNIVARHRETSDVWTGTENDFRELIASEKRIPTGTNVGDIVQVVGIEEEEDVIISALPSLSMQNLTGIEKILPPAEPGTVIVAAPASPLDPGELGQVAYEIIGGVLYKYTYVPELGWDRGLADVGWEKLAFIGPSISPRQLQVGAVESFDVSGRFRGNGRTYALIGAPSWMSIDADGVITGTAEVGFSSSIIVRATVGPLNVDSNPFSVSVSFDSATDFSEFTDGDWSETYRASHANAVLEIAAGGPANSGKALRIKNVNATASTFFSEYINVVADDISTSAWEVLALVQMSTAASRLGVGYVGGVIGEGIPATLGDGNVAVMAIKLDAGTPLITLEGSALTGVGGFINPTPADWLNDYVWVNVRASGTTIQGRIWKHGTARPDWTFTRTYAAPTPAENSGLGFYFRHRQTDVNQAAVLYFAATVGGASLQTPTWTLPSFPVVQPGALSYLNAWSPKTRLTGSGEARFAAFDYPLLAVGDVSGINPDTVLRKLFHLYASTNVSALAECATDCFKLVKATTQEYQGNDNTLFGNNQAFNALSPYTDESEGRLFPGHVAFQFGTTLSSPLSSDSGLTVNVTVDDATNIRVNQHALISPFSNPWANMSLLEWVYVTAKSGNTITFTRGWNAPLRQTGAALQRNHPAGSYIASVTTGGASTFNRSTNGGTPANVRHNWKWNVSTQCPLDSNGKTINNNLVTWVGRRLADAQAALGYAPDGMYDDVDRFWYNSQEGQLDADNSRNGVDFGQSSAASWWANGAAALKSALIAAHGPGTAMGCSLFMAGTEISSPEIGNGFEAENVYYDQLWTPEAKYTKLDQKIHTTNVNLTQVENGLGPAQQVNLFRVFTVANPCLQITYNATNPGPCDYRATDNKAARLNMALTWIFGGYFAMPQNQDYFPYWDEYGADPSNGYVCPAKTPENSAELLALRGWMGKPKGQMVRHYDPVAMALANNIATMNMTATTNPLQVQGGNGATATRITSGGIDNAAFWRYTPNVLTAGLFGPSAVSATVLGLTAGEYYTVVIWMRSSHVTEVLVNIAGDQQSLGVQWITSEWLPYVYTFKLASGDRQSMSIQFGARPYRLDIGRWAVFPGRASGYSRDFDRALILANTSPDPLTFALPAGANYKRLTGTQDSVINNGSTVTGSIEIPGRDGLVLGKVF